MHEWVGVVYDIPHERHGFHRVHGLCVCTLHGDDAVSRRDRKVTTFKIVKRWFGLRYLVMLNYQENLNFNLGYVQIRMRRNFKQLLRTEGGSEKC